MQDLANNLIGTVDLVTNNFQYGSLRETISSIRPLSSKVAIAKDLTSGNAYLIDHRCPITADFKHYHFYVKGNTEDSESPDHQSLSRTQLEFYKSGEFVPIYLGFGGCGVFEFSIITNKSTERIVQMFDESFHGEVCQALGCEQQ